MLPALWFVPICVATAMIGMVLSRRKEKRRKAEELKQLERDEQARLLEAERQAEEERRLEVVARLEEERTVKERVELTRFRGYLILLGGGIHDATNTSRIPA